MKPLRDRGYAVRTNNGYLGKINIANVVMDVQVTFWSDKKPYYIWIQRQKEKLFDETTLTFSDYNAKPFFECYAYKAKPKDVINYKGEFMFVGFKYELVAWFEDKTEHQINFEVTRSESQPILKRLNEINKEKYSQLPTS